MNSAPDCPLVSIALCTYNGSRFLAQQLDSLLAQTYANVEIVASDDCSSDDSLAILQRYARLHPNVRVVANAQNLGLPHNFERAIGLCRGAYIAPSDQDDLWLPEKISALVDAIGSRSMAYCDSTLIDERGRPLGYSMSQVVTMKSIHDPAPFAFGNCVSGHAMLFRRQLLDHALPIARGFFYDWWLAALAASCDGIEFCDRRLVLYRQHGANVTGERFAEMFHEAGLRQDSRNDDAASAPAAMHQVRNRGHRLRYLRETEQRLAALARLPGCHQSFLAELYRSWSARESQWISPRLWRLMSGNKDRLLALTKMSEKERSRYCADFLWGVRTKQITRRRAYAAK